MTKGITTNPEQRLFMIAAGGGYSCFGFQNCFDHAKNLSILLSRPDMAPREDEIGEIKQYSLYLELVRLAGSVDLGTYFDPDTPAQVRKVLEQYRLHGKPVRLFYGDEVTGRDWMDEHDVYGWVGRSMGPLKTPLLIARQECGGPAILTANVVRIQDGVTRRELYRHPTYSLMHFDVVRYSNGKYRAEVRANGKCHARFKTLASAERWVAFMRGETLQP